MSFLYSDLCYHVPKGEARYKTEIQAHRQTKEARIRAEEACKQAEEARKQAEEAHRQTEERLKTEVEARKQKEPGATVATQCPRIHCTHQIHPDNFAKGKRIAIFVDRGRTCEHDKN